MTGAAGLTVQRLKRRRQFTGVARGARWHAPTFTLQARRREDEAPHVGIGFTATRKLGGAVVRNRARRRLREAARQVLPDGGRPGVDYVLIARPAIVTCPFDQLLAELAAGLPAVARRLDRGPASTRPAKRP